MVSATWITLGVSAFGQASQPPQTVSVPPSTAYSTGSLTVAIIALVIVGLLFYLLLKWQQKQEQASYLATVFRDTVEGIEYKRLSASFEDKFNRGEYEDDVRFDSEWVKSNPLPQGYYGGATRSPYGDNRRPSGYTPRPTRNRMPGDGPPGLPRSGDPTNRPRRTAEEEAAAALAEQQYEDSRREWDIKLSAEARARYQKALETCRTTAHDLAAKATGDVDLSALRGRGAEFVLGFTTIASIVFAALALGVLRVLDTQQIGTLFAAIAGYVLGRATTGISPQGQRVQAAATQHSQRLEQVQVPLTPQPQETAPKKVIHITQKHRRAG